MNASTQLTSSLQAQLSKKSSLLFTHCEEVKRLKEQKRSTEDGLSVAVKQSREKQLALSSTSDRVCSNVNIKYMYILLQVPSPLSCTIATQLFF